MRLLKSYGQLGMDRKKKAEIIEVRSVMWDLFAMDLRGKNGNGKRKRINKDWGFSFSALASALSLSFLVVMMESCGAKDRLILENASCSLDFPLFVFFFFSPTFSNYLQVFNSLLTILLKQNHSSFLVFFSFFR